jgi:hypothetical protein
MAGIGVSEAARLVGRDVSTLHRMMKNGRLSYTTDSSGRRRLDPAELARLFQIMPVHGNGATQSMDLPHGESAQVVALLREAVQCRDAMLADLRDRLDASEAERRQLSERLHGLLTNRSNDMTGLRENSFATQEFPPGEPKPLRDATVSESRHGTEPSAASGLAIARPPWWRRWFR